jgi:hypothetical protein
MFRSSLAWKILYLRICLLSTMMSHLLEDDFTLLRPKGYVVDFFLEFFQCSFILKFSHNVATDHVNE